MKLHVKYFLYIGSLHAGIFALTLIYLRELPYVFLAVELALLASLYLAWRLYKNFVVPVRLLSAGAESLQDMDFSVKFNPVGQRELDALIQVYNRMIDQLRQERARATEQHFFLEKLIQASPAGILLMDLDGRLHSLNKAACRLLEVRSEEVIGKELSALPQPFFATLQSLETDHPAVLQMAGNRYYRCTKSYFIDRGFARQFMLIEELTREIVQAEKGAYDKVIRMMAHEVNNSVAAVNALMQTLADEYQADEEMHQAIRVVINRNTRLGNFMENFARVVKTPPPQLSRLSLNELLCQLIPLAEADCRKHGIRFSYCLPEQIHWIDGDANQLEQVLMNALKNAREAAGEGGAVKLELNAKQLRILNSGAGITPEVEKKLFTPFYSTKPHGQGIGLMLIREILGNHHFRFRLHTQPDGWTEFLIRWEK